MEKEEDVVDKFVLSDAIRILHKNNKWMRDVCFLHSRVYYFWELDLTWIKRVKTENFFEVYEGRNFTRRKSKFSKALLTYSDKEYIEGEYKMYSQFC